MSQLDEMLDELRAMTENNIRGVLYYDETNNFRHLHLTENGANNPIYGMSFVLGGIGSRSRNTDYSELIANLNIDRSIPELKFRHFSHGKTCFLDILKSSRINMLLHWIVNDQNIFIHLSSTNYLFWVLIDIVDEALQRYYEDAPQIFAFHLELKNALYDAITQNLDEFINQLYTFGFPDISNENIRSFVELVLAYIESRQLEELDGVDDFFTETLRQIIKNMREDKEFLYLSGCERYTLFDAYTISYEREISTFSKAKLVFDHEPKIEPEITKALRNYTNFIFKDSKDEVMIQLSDAVVGFASKLITYVEKVSTDDMRQDFNNMSEQQKNNLRLWFEVENKSSDVCEFLFAHMQPRSVRKKMALLEELIKG